MNDTSTPSTAPDLSFPWVPDVILTNWREALHQAGLSAGVQTVYSMAVSGFRYGATVEMLSLCA